MLSNKKRTEIMYSLLSAMLPDSVAQTFGFSYNANERIWLANTNQTPRGNAKTIMYFSFKDSAYKQARSDPHHYTNDNEEVMEQMRQIRLTVDVYSKVVPIGTANDVVRWLNTALISDQYEEWQHNTGYGIAVERIELMPDLTALLQDQTWNERAQMVVYLNYRDLVRMGTVYMTRKPESLEDTPNSVNAKTVLKN